jgi:hypothetical protein
MRAHSDVLRSAPQLELLSRVPYLINVRITDRQLVATRVLDEAVLQVLEAVLHDCQRLVLHTSTAVSRPLHPTGNPPKTSLFFENAAR